MEAIASYFKFAERGTNLATEVKAGRRDVHGHGLHRRREPEHHRRRPLGAAIQRRGRGGARRSIAGVMTHRHGRVRQLSRSRSPPAWASTRIVAFRLDRAWAWRRPARWAWSSGRRHRRHGARPRRLPRGDHERRTAVAEASDRRRHRPVHPVHRLRRRRADRRTECVARSGRLRRSRTAGQFVADVIGLLDHGRAVRAKIRRR